MDLLKFLKKESEERGATIIYATHIFDGLDDWPTHLHYLKQGGITGWQGRIENMDLYTTFRNSGEISPLLRIAEYWLRNELAEKKKKALEEGKEYVFEQADGEGAINSKDINRISTFSAGGFAPGRMSHFNFINGK